MDQKTIGPDFSLILFLKKQREIGLFFEAVGLRAVGSGAVPPAAQRLGMRLSLTQDGGTVRLVAVYDALVVQNEAFCLMIVLLCFSVLFKVSSPAVEVPFHSMFCLAVARVARHTTPAPPNWLNSWSETHRGQRDHRQKEYQDKNRTKL